jgi:hypothetical protein
MTHTQKYKFVFVRVVLDCFICLSCDHKNDDTNNTNTSINIIKTTAPLLLLNTDRSNTTAVWGLAFENIL